MSTDSSPVRAHDQNEWQGHHVVQVSVAECLIPEENILDVPGFVVTPGLVDMHVHIIGGGGEAGRASPQLYDPPLVQPWILRGWPRGKLPAWLAAYCKHLCKRVLS